MGVRIPTDKDAERAFSERNFKHIGRLYTLWLVGILIGVVKIRPEQLDIGGIKYSISNPEVLQGVIFFGCILYYIALMANMAGFFIEYVTTNKRIMRRLIIAGLNKRPTLKGRARYELTAFKAFARLGMKFVGLFAAIYLLLPLVHIVFFQQAALFSGVDAVFNTVSVKDGKVIAHSAPALVVLLFVLIIFTAVIYSWVKQRQGAGVGNLVWASMAATVVYATCDSLIRGRPWMDAWGGAFFAQLVILLVIALFFAPLKAMLWSQNLRLWWLQRRIAQIEARKRGEGP